MATQSSEQTVVIADSSALVSLASIPDSNHKLAEKIALKFKNTEGTIILPAEIFAETINTLWRKVSKAQALTTARSILGSATYSLVDTPSEIRTLALKTFERQRSKNISFTDCLVMAFAIEHQTKLIFGFDESFKKNGFKRLGID